MAAPSSEQTARPPRPGRSGRILLVRHLPASLTASEKESLLRHFGAASVRVLSDRGRLKHTAFATFPNENAATQALSRLHQLNLLGHTLVVEYAKDQDSVCALSQSSESEKDKSLEEPVKEEKEQKDLGCLKIESGIAPSHGLTFPINSCLKYRYPPPSSTILANIANALASVPKFYVQVLHLMNKMNLPPPFGPVTPRPPMYEEYIPLPPPIPPLPPEEPPLPEEEDSQDSSKDESEYESADEEEKERFTKLMELATFQPKRRIPTKPHRTRKKRKIKDLLNVSQLASHSNLHPALSPSDVFEQPHPVGLKKIEFHISSESPGILQKSLAEQHNNDIYAAIDEISGEGFGKILPALRSNHKKETEEEEEDDEIPSEFVSKRELEKGRVSHKEMETLAVFRNYEPGEPNCRIYVKNLSKQVQERDLKFIFGRYVDFSSETERIMFDIRLMKEGRMKGQAFVGLPNEGAAAKALKEVNGYVLFDKPMVVQFARSARPKPDPKEERRKDKGRRP
ncbi:RNA-binding region-containing protein 3 [Podarcis raffonei]|uniref:RNA-binding region-containing protein 3 n=1 Tax=Podarcis raffonei TaxID=65483 RepID=UPI0023297176|nr:RNA-binding region-containing protein 3 [Podarcis raffonei]XP_053247565.1 RNA-binding region-containing protein 3 [Podarcis raffonei]XP_053247566.1 RNA-binding region-containing protein 3 [Podarcis raffonei]